ncbi:hypothetical protein P5673_027203 [Acropora cervicornis]|uniref:Uncharacterized protein n=1 Tax=Acropora cervicornis TaxID=6130 RepID=A0AAD9PZA3_ACRCE|nr:hypothetical protein P5673_027203 [Acropora cervicornis]
MSGAALVRRVQNNLVPN